MWNNLKSDLYRIFHMKAFYITVSVGVIASVLLLVSTGFSMNSPFSHFELETDTFVDFMFYIIKSPLYAILLLIFLCIFYNDEYDKGFAKNILPITYKKSTLVIERYLISVIVAVLILFSMLGICGIVTMIAPLPHTESLQIIDFFIFIIVEVLLYCTMISILMMLNHLTKSRVLIILIASVFSMLILYMLQQAIVNWLFGNMDILKYTIYEQIGKLPRTFTWDGYKVAFLVIIGNTMLYNGISYYILKKKDL